MRSSREGLWHVVSREGPPGAGVRDSERLMAALKSTLHLSTLGQALLPQKMLSAQRNLLECKRHPACSPTSHAAGHSFWAPRTLQNMTEHSRVNGLQMENTQAAGRSPTQEEEHRALPGHEHT